MSVVVSGSFDDLNLPHVRLLDEAAKLGPVWVMLWSDEIVKAVTGKPPKFPLDERHYFVQAIRYVSQVMVVRGEPDPDALPRIDGADAKAWVVDAATDTAAKREYCDANSLLYLMIGQQKLQTVPPATPPVLQPPAPGRKKVLVTGCYDWMHSGHVRFFEEVSELGDLYVCLGHDANIAMLKGPGHPLFPQNRRRYLVQAVRYVKEAIISSGDGWVDADPEIRLIKPDIYAVNEDGDKPEKREYCRQHGLEYRVLKRLPKEGLPRRQSTDLRGF